MPLFKRQARDKEAVTGRSTLSGKWFGRVNGEPVGLEFKDDGRLAYVVLSGGKQQTILMTYRVHGDVLVTEQPSHPQEERTSFRFDGGALLLAFGGVESRFTRQ